MASASDPAALTDAERSALEGVIDRRTAKEMAQAEGVSHHAIEKRLKRAREKLGAATSIDAARLYADHYGRTLSGLSDLDPAAKRHDHAPVATFGRHRMIKGAIIMMLLTAIVAFAAIQDSGPARAGDDAITASLENHLSERATQAATLFESLDRNNDDAIDLAEWADPYGGEGQVTRVVRLKGNPDIQPMKLDSEAFSKRRAAIFKVMDADENGTVQKDEFTTHVITQGASVIVIDEIQLNQD